MEGGFQSMLITGKSAVGDDYFSPLKNSDEVYNDRGMSYQPLSYEKSMRSLLQYPYGSSYDIFNGGIRSKKIGECSKEDSKWRCIEREEKVKRAKNEHSTEPFNFSPTIMFSQLPDLQSMDQLNQEERRLKQSFPRIATTTNAQMLEPAYATFQLTGNYLSPTPLQQIHSPIPPTPKLPLREQARRRRNTLSDKTRSLQKVLPWDKKMDMATIYEETFKYIKFLQAQITALESMPVASTTSSNFGSENPRNCNMYGALAKLNRQQLLEVLVNSPAAQAILYSKGCCIYSLEQLILFKDLAEKSFLISETSIFP